MVFCLWLRTNEVFFYVLVLIIFVLYFSSDEVCFMKNDGRLGYRMGGSTDQNNVTLSECKGQEVRIGKLQSTHFFSEGCDIFSFTL